MTVTLRYETQLKRAIGRSSETIEFGGNANVDEVVRTAAKRHGDPVRAILLDDNGDVRTSVLVFAGDQQIADRASHVLTDGDTITLMSPISGG